MARTMATEYVRMVSELAEMVLSTHGPESFGRLSRAQVEAVIKSVLEQEQERVIDCVCMALALTSDQMSKAWRKKVLGS
jgi:hypothetical protein